MIFSEYYQLFVQGLLQSSWLEIVAMVTGVTSIWLNKKVNILVYPVGIISVLIYVYICYNAKLYADMIINFVYFVMSIYGWYNWARPHKNETSNKLKVGFQSQKARWISAGIALISFVVMAFLLSKYTDSDVPYIDAFTTALCIIGMFLAAQKKVENWIYYIIADLVSVPLYFYKGLIFTSVQYIIFLVIAVMAYITWRKEALQND
jgi:nicotinamide mononucleotide transporter PnuC